MKIPFAIEQFLQVFENYNLAIWPMQIFAYLLGIAALFLVYGKKDVYGRIISAVLSFYWLWMGIVYHLIYFSSINKPAYAFGTLFIVQGLLLLIYGVFKSNLSFSFKLDSYSITGSIFALYAMVIYPIIGYLSGHSYPRSPGFGVAPCPTAIFTFGLLLYADKKVPIYVLVIPFIWSIIGFSAALSLRIREDFGLLVAGILGTFMIIYRRKIGR
jgi:hypothetical protein